MDVGIGVGRTIVQDEFFGSRARLTYLFVQIHLGPLLQTRGFALRQVRLLREFGFRQIDCLLEFECWRFSRHKASRVKKRNSNRLNARSSKSPSPFGRGWGDGLLPD